MQQCSSPRWKPSLPLFSDSQKTEVSRLQTTSGSPNPNGIPEQSRKFKKIQGPGSTFQQFSTLWLDWRYMNLKQLNILQAFMIKQNFKLLNVPLVGNPATSGLALIDHVHACKVSKSFYLIRLQYAFTLRLALNRCDIEHTKRGKEREGEGGRKGRNEEDRKRGRKIWCSVRSFPKRTP